MKILKNGHNYPFLHSETSVLHWKLSTEVYYKTVEFLFLWLIFFFLALLTVLVGDNLFDMPVSVAWV